MRVLQQFALTGHRRSSRELDGKDAYHLDGWRLCQQIRGPSHQRFGVDRRA